MRTELLSPTHPSDSRSGGARSANLRLDLPGHVVERLADRAKDAGQSLEWYINTELSRLAIRPTAAELLTRIRSTQPAAA